MSRRYQAGFIFPGYDPLEVPDAPTIGTATAGNEQISITFTAPADTGGGAITAYNAVAITGGATVATQTGSSSPIVITGLTNGTAYTVKVWAVNLYGPSSLSAASGSATPALNIGDAYEGGFFAGQISTAGNGVADYNLVIAPKSSGENSSKQWKTSNTTTAGTSSVIDGPTNSANMNNASHPAAQFCEGLSIGGFSDWYMPAKNELEVCYFNLKPGTTNNNTSSGTNTNAVPSRGSNYTNSPRVPNQTAATDFQTGNAEAFAADVYWSSTESSATNAWNQDFDAGGQDDTTNKNSSKGVRAVRRVAV
jgi:hypothetical protein